jgi:hypothetical protein
MTISDESKDIIESKCRDKIYEILQKHNVLTEGDGKDKIFGVILKNKITEKGLSPEILTALNKDMDLLATNFDWLTTALEPDEKFQLEKDKVLKNGLITEGHQHISPIVKKLTNDIYLFTRKLK